MRWSTNDGNTRRHLKIGNQACYCNGVKTCTNEMQIAMKLITIHANMHTHTQTITRLNYEPLASDSFKTLCLPGSYQTLITALF